MKTCVEELLRMSPDERQKTMLFEAAATVTAEIRAGIPSRVYQDEFYTAPPAEHRVTMDVTDEQWGMLTTLVYEQIKHHERYIERARNYPSETIRSETTQDRHRQAINKWERILAIMSENVW